MMYETTNRSRELVVGFVRKLRNHMNAAELKKFRTKSTKLFSFYLRPPPTQKNSIFVKNVEMEINAWEDSLKFIFSEAM